MSESREHDMEQLADQLEREADRLEQQSDKLGQEIDDAREDWRRKRADPAVPGAVPPDEDAADDPE